MAKVVGDPLGSGAVGNVIYYQLNGKWYVKRKPQVSKKTIMTAPSRERQRENMYEFGYASHFGKLIRDKWNQLPAKALGPYVSGSLSAELVNIVRMGKGIRGKRSTEMSKYGNHLEGFVFSANRNPHDHFNQKPTVHTETDQNGIQIKLEMPAKATHNARLAHEEATHYLIHLHAIVISDHHVDPKDHTKQLPAHPGAKPVPGYVTSEPIPIGKSPGTNGNLALSIATEILPEQSVIISYGLEYVKVEGGKVVNISINKPRARSVQYDAYMVVLSIVPTIPSPIEENSNHEYSEEKEALGESTPATDLSNQSTPPEITPDTPPEINPQTTPEIIPQITPDTKPEIKPEMPPEITPTEPGKETPTTEKAAKTRKKEPKPKEQTPKPDTGQLGLFG